MPVNRRFLSVVSVLALFLLFPLAGSAALAQDAPPHEGEGVRRPAPAPPAKVQAGASKAPVAKRKTPAATASRKAPDAKREAKPPLRSVDANHDGRVSREEYLAGARQRFAKADANRDGVISAQEAKAAKLALQQKRDRAEARRQAKGQPAKPKRKDGTSAKPYLSGLDSNKDGRVSQKEYLARREKAFAAMDLNRDGVVSREEARSAKKQAQQRREAKKAQAKAKRQRRAEEARQKSLLVGMSSPGPEYVGTVTPPPAPPAETPAASPPAQFDLPLTPIAPGVPAHAEPET
jgi:Ca2+-binding EF-hand superfamily protein